MANISLKDGEGDTFVLSAVNRNGKTQRIVLDEDDIINLGQSAQHLKDQILARRSRPGADAIVLTPVAQFYLNVDHHKTEIQLTMIDRRGARMGFSVPPHVAQSLIEPLRARLADIANAKPTKQ
jgi:hypothetical protein